MSKTYTYNFPMPSITVDCAMFRFNEYSGVDILLIKRKNEPYKDCWALPGGFMDIDESLEDAVKREVMEETNVDLNKSCILYLNEKIYDKPDRDPRNRVISMLSIAVVPNSTESTAGDDAKEIKWFSLRNLPQLAFDHKDMIEYSIKKINCSI